MHIMLKIRPPRPFRGRDIDGGGIHSTPHASNNNKGLVRKGLSRLLDYGEKFVHLIKRLDIKYFVLNYLFDT